MSSSKVQNLTELAEAPASGDLLIVWDVSENDADGTAGKPKKITSANALAGYQPLDALLAAIAALSMVADRYIYGTGTDTVALGTITAFARTLLDDVDQAAARTTLALTPGTDVQAYSAQLAAIAALSPSNDDIIQRKAGAWTNRTIAQLLSDLGLSALYQPLDTDLTDLVSRWVAASASGPASLDFHEDTDNGSNRVRLSAPSSVASDITVTLPSAAGTVITTADAASASASGIVELATDAETLAGTDTDRAVTPAGAASVYLKGEQAFNAQTGTTYTLAASDIRKVVSLNNGSAITVSFPQDSDATIAVGESGDFYMLGAGQATFQAGSGATLRVSGLTAKSRAQYSRIGWQKVSANTFNLYGDLAAS